MKILLLYVPRCGSNSIVDYFLKQKKEYKHFNQPFAIYNYELEVREKYSYEYCISQPNVIIKNEISSFTKLLNIPKKVVFNDFDKIITLTRRDKREQAISYLVANKNKNFTDRSKRKYYIDDISEEDIKRIENVFKKQDKLLKKFKHEKTSHFYYEDLFYGDFSKLFEVLELKYIENDFKKILEVSNRYMSGIYQSKKTKTLF